MAKRSYLLLLLLGGSLLQSPAQTLFHSHGKLPSSFIGKPSDRAQKKVDQQRNEGSIMDASEAAFTYITEYTFNNFITSGRITTGDTVSRYAERILDKLLAKDQKLRKKINVYLLRSTEVNAFMLGNGSILLSTALMAHLQNEAQLAFILSHEIIHFREHHNLQEFRARQRATDRYFDPTAAVLRFSRDLELEADQEGVKLFRASGYALHEGYAALQMLDHSDWSFQQVPFSPSFFEHGDYRFPVSYTQKEIQVIEKSDAERDETRSTHPGLEKRLRVITPLLGDTAIHIPLYQISETTFQYLQTLCRHELINLYLEERNYPEAIYGAYIFLKKDSTDAFAQEVIGKALYNLAIYYSESEIYRIPEIFVYEYNALFDADRTNEPDYKMQGPEDVPGECQRLVYFFHKLYPFEWNILALDWNWKLNQKSNYSKEHQDRCEHLMELLKAYQQIGLGNFSKKQFSPSDTSLKNYNEKLITTTKQELETKDAIEKEIRLKYKDRQFYTQSEFDIFWELLEIKIEKALVEQNEKILDDPALLVTALNLPPQPDSGSSTRTKYRYYEYAFTSHLNDQNFVNSYLSARSSKRENVYKDFNASIRSGYDRSSNYGLGTGRMVIISPNAVWLDEIKRTEEFDYNTEKSNLNQAEQEKAIGSASKSARADIILLSPEKMDSIKTTDYTTYCMLKSWINERSELGGNAELKTMAYDHLGDSLAERLNTRYVASTFVVTRHMKRIRSVPLFVLGVLFPVTTIPVLIYGVVPNNHSRMSTVVYDLKTGEVVMLYQQNMKQGMNSTNMTLYYSTVFNKIKKTKKTSSEE